MLAYLGRFNNLERLILKDTKITDDQMSKLPALPKLTQIKASGCHISGAAKERYEKLVKSKGYSSTLRILE